MIGSRGIVLGRLVQRFGRATVRRQFTTTQVQKSGHVWTYRGAAPPPPWWARYGAEIVGGIMWWWVLWHLWHEPEHITGEFPYPNPSEWTNAELGIPPDDEGLAERLEE